jgi:hypothetical protein
MTSLHQHLTSRPTLGNHVASVATRSTFFGPPQPDRPMKAKGSVSSSVAGHLAARPWTGILGISAAGHEAAE